MDTRKTIELAVGASTNGSYPSSEGVLVEGGPYALVLEGDFQGATAKLKLGKTAAGVTELTDGTFTAASSSQWLPIGRGLIAMLDISGVSSPAPNISAWLVPIPTAGAVR